jgi:hypothetical protein
VSEPLTDFQIGVHLASVLAKGVLVEPFLHPETGVESLRLRPARAAERLSDLMSDFDRVFLRDHRDRILALSRGARTDAAEPTRSAPTKADAAAPPSPSATWARPAAPPDEPVIYFGERRVDADDVALMLSGLDDDAQTETAKLPLAEQYAMARRWLVQRRHILRAESRRA